MTDRDKIAERITEIITNFQPYDYEEETHLLGGIIAEWILENRPEFCDIYDENEDFVQGESYGKNETLELWTKNMAEGRLI